MKQPYGQCWPIYCLTFLLIVTRLSPLTLSQDKLLREPYAPGNAARVFIEDLSSAASTVTVSPAADDSGRLYIPDLDLLDSAPNNPLPPLEIMVDAIRPVQPPVLRSPVSGPEIRDEFDAVPESLPEWIGPMKYRSVPLGYTGPSGITETESQSSAHFVPIHDRWRIGFSEWDRYGDAHPVADDYPYVEGHWWDPFNQNVMKGDYPILGQHTFLDVAATSLSTTEMRTVPTPTTPFESTFNPFEEGFFGNPKQFFHTHFLRLSLSLFHGNAAFKPLDWQVRVTPVFNLNYLDVKELGVVNPDVRFGRTRYRNDYALEEWFVEKKLADLSPDYDFMSARVGSQPFVSDFRGLVFADINRGVRLFGTRLSNRDQFNLVFFDQTEKDTNSSLNTFDDRHQNTVIANYFRQDFVFPGYTAQASFHYNDDQPSLKFDRNDFLVRPDPAGVFRRHHVQAYYLGFAGDGHIGRINVSHAFYHVAGRDSRNPIAGRKTRINANMAAVELSYDRDWVRFRASWFWSSGDDNPLDGKAEGFDTILDVPNFAGGGFSYWQRQAIRLFGVNLVQRESLVPNLRSSKTQGQSNFVNPGLSLVNGGMDFEITPKVRAITNLNFLWFDKTETLQEFTFQSDIDRRIGADLSLGMEYRPLLNDNIQLIGGVAGLFPGAGFDDLFGATSPFALANASRNSARAENMYSLFLDVILQY